MNARPEQSVSFDIQSRDDFVLIVSRVSRSPLLLAASDVDRTLVTTIVSELCSNIAKYAGSGSLNIKRIESGDRVDICIHAQDHGPGIANIALALEDHFSTGGTLGLGLPGVKRMADEFTVSSSAGTGTQVFVRKRIVGRPDQHKASAIFASPRPDPGCPDGLWDVSARIRAFPASLTCGDAALALQCAGGLLLAVVDASGHGTRASTVAQQAIDVLTRHCSPDLVAMLEKVHHALRGTLGAAVGLAFVNPVTRTANYAGVGNTQATKIGRSPWQGIFREGTLGERMPPHFLGQTTFLEDCDILLLTTDGIPEVDARKFVSERTYWSAANLTQRLLAEVAKPCDDAGCVILKWQTRLQT